MARTASSAIERLLDSWKLKFWTRCLLLASRLICMNRPLVTVILSSAMTSVSWI